jgi:Trk K+ transport system NAD-binding subunit
LPIAYLPVSEQARILLDVPADAELRPGDRLVVCGRPSDLEHLSGANDEAREVRWSGWLRRAARVAWRAVREIDLPVKVCAVTLAVVLLGSTAVVHYGSNRPVSWADAVYQTVSVMATGSDLPAQNEWDFMKVFVSGLRIAGAALFAAFTAILTNYLVRARLGGVLELRRVPDGGHVVVCGLGNVGFRVTEELLQAGQPVVVIDPAREGRFHATARRLGAAVVAGDATVAEVLRQANSPTARAVIAVTSNDLVNVEIALLVRELQPRQRVVVRLTEPVFARTLRDAANVRLAFSLPALAAPAFVAALYGDQVQSVFLVGERLVAAVELSVSKNEPCLDGEAVRAVMIDFGLLPVALATADGRPVDHVLSHRLGPGDRLTALATPADLDRLYRRDRPPADCAVAIDSFPLSARDTLAVVLPSLAGVAAEEVDRRLARMPCELRSGLTPGQAEDRAALLRRERVQVTVSRCPSPAH